MRKLLKSLRFAPRESVDVAPLRSKIAPKIFNPYKSSPALSDLRKNGPRQFWICWRTSTTVRFTSAMSSCSATCLSETGSISSSSPAKWRFYCRSPKKCATSRRFKTASSNKWTCFFAADSTEWFRPTFPGIPATCTTTT